VFTSVPELVTAIDEYVVGPDLFNFN
jgi:hypothetical protein